MRNSEKLVAGLRKRGVVLPQAEFYIYRRLGQPMMNKKAGEAASTWILMCDALRHSISGRIVKHGHYPDITFEGRTDRNVELGSHHPLLFILGQNPEKWDIGWCDIIRKRFVIYGDGLPPSWGLG